jgi:hypothetical protein
MAKTEADNLKRVEIWWLLRDMKGQDFKGTTLSWGKDGSNGSVGCDVSIFGSEPYVRFHYTTTDSTTGIKQDEDYKVMLVKSACHYGSFRYWFLCPLYKDGAPCGKRVGVLYKGDNHFGCRHCYDLTYSSKNNGKTMKAHPEFQALMVTSEIEKLEKKARRKTWKGIPTKKQQKLDRLYKKSVACLQNFERKDRQSVKN